MPSSTAAPWSIIYALPVDEIKAFPAEVDQVKAERIAKLFGEHVLTITEHAAAYAAKSGELGIQTKAGETTTAPAAGTKDQLFAVTCKASSCKVTTSGGAFIYGKWLTLASKTATVTLTEDMTAFFQADGTNWLLWGEVKNETAYGALVERTALTEYEPSATRPVLVILSTSGSINRISEVTVGGVKIQEGNGGEGAPVSFECPPGVKWKAQINGGKLYSSYLVK